MVKVITYGTYDMLHYGHIRLLERAKNLGDYLIVGITSDDFDIARGKINVKHSLAERIQAVIDTGLADEIVIEEYEGQKIDDIRKYNIDIFAIGSDWTGKFDYLNEFCEVVYLERTKGVSSTALRSNERHLRLGLVGDTNTILEKINKESKCVNGLTVVSLYSETDMELSEDLLSIPQESYKDMLTHVDAVYIGIHPDKHDYYIRLALQAGKHVLCEPPLAIDCKLFKAYEEIAVKSNLVLMEGIKTAHSLGFERLLLLVKTGIIGDVVCIDASCSSLTNVNNWGSMHAWGAFGLLPAFSIFGIDYQKKSIVTKRDDSGKDIFTQVTLVYRNGIANVKVGQGVKTEGELIISGTKGYILVPSPWWKTDYFEVRYENMEFNKRYFYQLNGEGIGNMLAHFVGRIMGKDLSGNGYDIAYGISRIMGDFKKDSEVYNLK